MMLDASISGDLSACCCVFLALKMDLHWEVHEYLPTVYHNNRRTEASDSYSQTPI